MLFSAGAGAPFFHVWPRRDNPDLDQPGSPGVTRTGTTLAFDGPVPWSGRHTAPKRGGHRVSFGDAPPEESPDPRSWEHYSTTAVTLHGEGKGVETLTPAEFETKARTGYFVITLVQNLLIATVFFFVISMLLRAKRPDPRGLGALDVLARCLIPACLISGALLMLGTHDGAMLSAIAFLLVLSLNALLWVLWARPAKEPETFAV